MVKRLKKPLNLIALIIALSVPVFSGYLLYYDMADDDLSPPDATFENADIDDLFLLPDCQNQLTFFGLIESNLLLTVCLPETNVNEQVSPFCSLLSCLEQNTFVLRC